MRPIRLVLRRCIIAVAAICSAGVAHCQIVFTEIMHSPGGADAVWEWAEIQNLGASPLDLDGWVFDDDDDSSVPLPNISSDGGTRNTIVPAGGVAVLYAGDQLDFAPERFHAAWGAGITLIGVNGLTTLTASDAIGLWPSHAGYLADAIPMTTSSPRRTFANAAAVLDYSTNFPTASSGRSIAWNGNGSASDGTNWVASQLGFLQAVRSKATTIADAQINSTDDMGNPGVLPPGAAAAGLSITEIMYAPKSPLAGSTYSEIDFEWIEIVNNTTEPIDFAARPHVFDDDDGSKLSIANLRSGSLAIGEVGVLFNRELLSIADMQTMWDANTKFLPVYDWPSLSNSTGGDTIAIWPTYSAYNTEAVTGAGRTHQNAIAAMTYNTRADQGWPAVNNQSSIWLDDLDGDPNFGPNWIRSEADVDTLSWFAAPLNRLVVDHEGGDFGSPGWTPLVVPGFEGDFNGDGDVDAADYVLWRKNGGSSSQYDAWRANFGSITPGAASGWQRFGVVPEPTSTAIGGAIVMLVAVFSRRRSSPVLRSLRSPAAQ